MPITGLHRLVIYYPVENSMVIPYYHRVEYSTEEAIKPSQVLTSIFDFYAQPYTQSNANAIAKLMRVEPIVVEPGDTIADTLYGQIFFEGLYPYNDGFVLQLGS